MEKEATSGCYSWADLNSELLVSIATAVDGLSLRDYKHLRSVCTAWRSALPPPYPWCLLYLADNRPSRTSRRSRCFTAAVTSTSTTAAPTSSAQETAAVSLPLRRSFRFGMATTSTMYGRRHVRVVGSGNDHTSISSIGLQRRIQLKTDTSSTELQIRTRVVGSGNGRFAVAIDHANKRNYFHPADGGIRFSFWTARILLVCPRTGKEVGLVPPPMKGFECVHKIVFAPDQDDGTVVAICDDRRIAYIDTNSASGDDMNNWTAIDVEHLVDLVFDDGGGKVYCLNSYGGVRVIPIPRGSGGRNKQDELPAAVADEPSSLTLPSVAGAAAFPPPYDTVSTLTSTKHLFFCNGSLYQMWHNTSVTINLSNGLTMSEDEIFVLKLKHDPGSRCPYWNVVKDLQGCSVFIGKNSNPIVMRRAAGGGAVPGVRPDCVYWIDWRGVPMVCDVATGTSKPYVDLPYGPIKGSRPCWYYDDANMTSIMANRELIKY